MYLLNMISSIDTYKVVNMGLKLFTAHEGDAYNVGYRLCQDAVNLILPHVTKVYHSIFLDCH